MMTNYFTVVTDAEDAIKKVGIKRALTRDERDEIGRAVEAILLAYREVH